MDLVAGLAEDHSAVGADLVGAVAEPVGSKEELSLNSRVKEEKL